MERIAWVIPGLIGGNFVGAVIYQDGRTEKIEGNAHGFCALDPNHKMGSFNWLTPEERGVVSELFDFQPWKKVDDTSGTAKSGPVNDIAGLAYYMNRTKRYNHYPMGRAYHLTRLVAHINKSEDVRWIDLPSERVFMDRHLHTFYFNLPGTGTRLAGHAIIEGHVHHGPAASVYGYFQGRLQKLARISWHGSSTGWVNLIGTGDFDGDGCVEIALIRNPQENGSLELWEMRYEASPSGTPFSLVLKARSEGFSNHVFGTLAARLSVVADVNFDGILDLIVPDRSRTTLRVMSFVGDQFTEIHRVELPSAVAYDMTYDSPFSYKPKRGYTLVVPLEDNTVHLVQLPNWERRRFKRPPECAGAYRPN